MGTVSDFLLVCVFTFTLYGNAYGQGENPCPDSQSIEPCLCFYDGLTNLDMVCSAAEDEDELASAFMNSESVFPVNNFRKLTIEHDGSQNLTSLKETTFGTVTFEMVEINGAELSALEGDVFHASQDTLWNLDLSYNQFAEFPYLNMSHYSQLAELNLAYNQITMSSIYSSQSLVYINLNGNQGLTLVDGLFSQMPNITLIYLDNIGLNRLSSGILNENFERLALISLLNNELKTLIHDSISTSSRTLKTLFLSGNKLLTLEDRAISGMAPNATIFLEKNFLYDIKESVWSPVFDEISPAGIVDFSDNPLTCGCNIAWIIFSPEYMNLISEETTCYGGYDIHELPKEAFETHCTPS